MPTYQYACTACDHRFEAVQSFSDASLTTCPACSGMLRKVFSSVGIVFKGSGFYRTDSRAGSTVTNGEASKNGAGKDGAGKDSAPNSAPNSGGSGDSGSGSGSGSKDSKSVASTSSASGASSTPAAAAS
ncbi:MAG TPA: FmdB family zinc ribbon protein [Actinophytocola sp.]|nr:FmdB family zinc ribbon protein [Actinophytocola sp.]